MMTGNPQAIASGRVADAGVPRWYALLGTMSPLYTFASTPAPDEFANQASRFYKPLLRKERNG